jgi:uncharacterized protein YicC (UPF0701 family)
MSDDDAEQKQQRSEAYAALEAAIEKLSAMRHDEGEVVCDAVLLLGVQYIDEDGDRAGYVDILPRHVVRRLPTTAGLLEMAHARVVAPTIQIRTGDDE